MIVKKQVLVEQHILKTAVSPIIDQPSANPPTTGFISFTLSFLELIACIKLELGHYHSNKKQKLLQDGAASQVSPNMALEFNDGYFCFDYTNAAHIPFCGVLLFVIIPSLFLVLRSSSLT
jgi:hypothetical protein